MYWDTIDEGIVCHKFDSGIMIVLKDSGDGTYAGSARAEGREIGAFSVKAASMEEAQSKAVAAVNKLAAEAMRAWADVVESTDPCLDAVTVETLDLYVREGKLVSGTLKSGNDWPTRHIHITVAADGVEIPIELSPSSAGAACEAVKSLNVQSIIFMKKAVKQAEAATAGSECAVMGVMCCDGCPVGCERNHGEPNRE